MQRNRFYYLIRIQYLGYRLHGWQRQPDVKTVEGLLHKTLRWVMPKAKFKILGTSRTDAMVSAGNTAFELFVDHEPLEDIDEFLKVFNKNLPQDIKALEIEEVDAKFSIIQHSKMKEYAYLFCCGEKYHPFCAPFMANFQEDLDIEKMKLGARMFEGTHDFRNYSVRVSEKSTFERTIIKSEIEENQLYTANFFPQKSYVFHIHGAGFLRHQVRLMMGAMVLLGRGELSLEDIQESLQAENSHFQMDYIAPASGLILNKTIFD
ncbi:tRNA pseudouridine(38-40) synthase TruA [Christiangramia fulva]|uniref:tRNA pseudouridine synthase A n=1 Tax=Christiangramia fulva TaxID=2126553 RepID=A0A2R3Z7F5_9FLAO|nr:tRNA pseudouridine(38-40) synthase TruA [Christiangramia fulva]AVR46211.1 tRNA pseudouridine(38-40) synthase TruA [Christiangramia fulva]